MKMYRLKPHLVARRLELQGINFQEIFAPIVKWSTIHAIVVVAIHEDSEIIHMDVKTIFLNGDLNKEVYMI
jgi:hypothetical protein